jgi:hypothetical protein
MGEQTGEYRSLDAMPSEPTYGPALTIEVDGEAFEFRPDGRGGTHYDWLSGPNDGYGFTTSPTEGSSLDDHRGFIRNFLGQIDPAAGVIGD